MLYGGKILYICNMVDCTGGAITWQMQCQAHAVKATMDDFFWWKLQVQIQLQIFCTKFNANKITSNNFCMTIPVIVIVICRNVREKKRLWIKCKSTLSRHTSLMHFDSDIEYVFNKMMEIQKCPLRMDGGSNWTFRKSETFRSKC